MQKTVSQNRIKYPLDTIYYLKTSLTKAVIASRNLCITARTFLNCNFIKFITYKSPHLGAAGPVLDVTRPIGFSPSSVSSVNCRRSLQQNTVRDATQHGNTLQRRRQSGEGGVMRFSAKETVILKVNCKNATESGRDWPEKHLRFLKLKTTPRKTLVFIERKVQVANFTAHSSEEAWHATRPA